MKDGLDEHALDRLAEAIDGSWSDFNRVGFLEEARAGLNDLELKARVRHIIAVMNVYLPDDYRQALKIVVSAGERFPPGRQGDALAGFRRLAAHRLGR